MDRNSIEPVSIRVSTTSLSARRAWIETTVVGVLATLVTVALRKESVDRNYYADKDADWVRGRSPQGERG